MSDKKLSSVEYIFVQIKASRNDSTYWNDLMLVDWLLEQEDILKAMHQKELEDAYDRKLINDIQNWSIRGGKHYYELHYKKDEN